MDSSVGELGESLIVGDDDEGLSKLITQVEKELVQFSFMFGVERARGFVSQNDRRIVDEGTCYCHTLFLTARQFCRLVLCSVTQIEEIEQLFGTVSSLFLALPCNEGWDAHVLQSRELRQKLMKLKNETQLLIAETSQFLVFETSDIN